MFKFSRGWLGGAGGGETERLLFIANNDITIKFNRTGKEIEKNKIKVPCFPSSSPAPGKLDPARSQECSGVSSAPQLLSQSSSKERGEGGINSLMDSLLLFVVVWLWQSRESHILKVAAFYLES